MANLTPYVQAAGAAISLGAAIISFINARNAKKSEKNAKESEEEIQNAKLEMRRNISNKNKIAVIAEVKSKTDVFQKVISKYHRDLEGLNIKEDILSFSEYMSDIKENNWIFEDESSNFGDVLYAELAVYYNQINSSLDPSEMKSISLTLKPKLENFKSALNKISNQNIMN
ncbi:hypothetical protein [Priestia aryabhattai]|uniref:DUF4760 domain-containing protein n=1 Tax=Priestia aryabhattai TaxID=412384 RepID=A0ABD7X2F5_PRIAR|nr:hypothetical protein [Priestia aryabhattai]WEA46826.1 hypothetical protein PWO00_12940 [Priestia aryabhattai]